MEELRRRRFLKIYDDDDNNYDELETKTRIQKNNWKKICLLFGKDADNGERRKGGRKRERKKSVLKRD